MKNVVIKVLNGPMDGSIFKRVISSDKPITIGRLKERDVSLQDGYVSSNHAKISYEDDKYWINDSSTNGTYLNDNKIHNSKVELPVGTIFKVGNTLLKFEEVSEREEIVDQLCKLRIINESMKLSEMKNLKKHPKVDEIEKSLKRAMSESSDLKDVEKILKEYLETICKILEKPEPIIQPHVPPCPIPFRQEVKEMDHQEFIKSIKNFIIVEPYEKIFEVCLFSWDKIPGKDDVKLIEFLKQNFGVEWIKTAKIEKIDDGNTIKVSTEKNYLSFRLNDKKTIANLEIDDGRTGEFRAKTEKGKLNIYRTK